MEVVKDGLAITTRDLKAVHELQVKFDKLSKAASVLNDRKKKLKIELTEKANTLITLIEKGTPIHSNKFIVTVKDHEQAAYINWQKEYRANHPSEYEAIKEEYGKEEWKELCIAESGLNE